MQGKETTNVLQASNGKGIMMEFAVSDKEF